MQEQRRGLMPPAGQQTPASDAAGMTMPPAAGMEESVTPDEQAAYNQFVTNGLRMMFDEKVVPQLLESIDATGNPVDGMADAMVSVVRRLEDSAQKAGAEIPGPVKYHGAVELMENLSDLVSKAGIADLGEEQMESALFLALDKYRVSRAEDGSLPKDELQQDMEALIAAEQQGSLDEMLPGLSEYAQRAPKPPAGVKPA